MNSEQMTSLLRTVLQFGAGIAVTNGYLDNSTATQIVGGIVAILATAWSLYTRRNTGLVASAATVPSVQTITTTSDRIATSVTSPKVVPAV